jgi:phosphoglycolate phosphatase
VSALSTGDRRAVVFDLDGTLVDSRLDLAIAVNRTRAAFELPELPVESVMAMVGDGARSLVRRALGGAPSEHLLDRALARFLVEYEPIATLRTRPYPGISELVERLRACSRLAVLTNKPERSSRAIVAACGWAETFEELIGGDTLATRKPDPAGLVELARRFGLPLRAVVLVGDSAIDAATADAAGARFVWVEWGFARPEDRAALGRRERARDAAELAARLGAG